MNVVFRVDASLTMGLGHLMRCLTLAQFLKTRGHHCTFICREHPGAQPGLVLQAGHTLQLLPVEEGQQTDLQVAHAGWLGADWQQDASRVKAILRAQQVDWLVVDHYALDQRWQQALRGSVSRLMVIDDLADREHDCDLLLDQNLGRKACDYDGRLPGSARRMIGPGYALLRPEFAERRSASLQRREQQRSIGRILISMGGVDPENATEKVLVAIEQAKRADLVVTVVMGNSAPWLGQVQARANGMRSRVSVLCGVGNMADLMLEHDLCIGAAGSTSWERCCLGMPAILVCLADNQKEVIAALEAGGAIRSFDKARLFDSPGDLLPLLDACERQLSDLSGKAAKVTDGLGGARIVREMEACSA